MLKKTTVYLSNEDLKLLRKKATIQDVTISEAIRLSIKESCRPKSKEEKIIWDSLDKVWAKTAKLDALKVESAVNKAVKEVRNGKKVHHRS